MNYAVAEKKLTAAGKGKGNNMITTQPTPQMLTAWKQLWLQYRDKLWPNRKSGEKLLCYLREKYELTEIREKTALEIVRRSILENPFCAEKLPRGSKPNPKAFFVENRGNGSALYAAAEKEAALWNGRSERIFVGLDIVTGFFMVEGSSLLWDELYVFRGLDEQDLENYVCVAEYIACMRRFSLPMQPVRMES